MHDVRSVVRYHHQIPATIGLCIHPTCKPRPRSASSQQVLLPPHWPRPGPRPRAAGCQNGAVSVSEPRRPQSPARHSRTFTEIRKQAASPQHSELALSLSLSLALFFLHKTRRSWAKWELKAKLRATRGPVDRRRARPRRRQPLRPTMAKAALSALRSEERPLLLTRFLDNCAFVQSFCDLQLSDYPD